MTGFQPQRSMNTDLLKQKSAQRKRKENNYLFIPIIFSNQHSLIQFIEAKKL